MQSISVHLLVEGETFVIVCSLELRNNAAAVCVHVFSFSFIYVGCFIFEVGSQDVALAGPVLVI